jgi:hypothetical protein
VKLGGDFANSDRMRALEKCRELSKVSMENFSRGIGSDRKAYQDSARIYDECAKKCEELAKDKFLYQCALVCRRCEEFCETMAKMK